jgi:hypothetical protein
MTDAATPAAWSPGSAFSGTVIVNGTTAEPPAGISTAFGMAIQVPASVDSWSEASMSNLPASV